MDFDPAELHGYHEGETISATLVIAGKASGSVPVDVPDVNADLKIRALPSFETSTFKLLLEKTVVASGRPIREGSAFSLLIDARDAGSLDIPSVLKSNVLSNDP